jgi:hypothetical protein
MNRILFRWLCWMGLALNGVYVLVRLLTGPDWGVALNGAALLLLAWGVWWDRTAKAT